MYSASKHAVLGFADSLRPELEGYGIGVTVLCPDYVKTNLSKNAVSFPPRSPRRLRAMV